MYVCIYIYIHIFFFLKGQNARHRHGINIKRLAYLLCKISLNFNTIYVGLNITWKRT